MQHLRNRGFNLGTTSVALLLLIIVLTSLPTGFAPGPSEVSRIIITREVPLTRKVVLVGFDLHTIDPQSILTGKLDFGLRRSKISQTRDLVDNALEKHNSMKYVHAIRIAVLAVQVADGALIATSAAPNAVTSVGLLSLVLGIVIGSSLMFLALRRYSHEVIGGK